MTYDKKDQDLKNVIGADATLILTSLEKDWREMCGNELRPSNAGLDPLRMEDTLPFAFVLKRTGPGASRLRVAGQKVHDLFFEDLSGRNFASLFGPASADTAAELMEAAFTLPAITSFSVVAKRSLGRRAVRGQVILLPMRDPQGEISRILGAFVTDGTACPHPLRFEIDHTQPIRCDAQEGSFPDRRARSRSYLPEVEADVPKHGHLRLVVNNV